MFTSLGNARVMDVTGPAVTFSSCQAQPAVTFVGLDVPHLVLLPHLPNEGGGQGGRRLLFVFLLKIIVCVCLYSYIKLYLHCCSR